MIKVVLILHLLILVTNKKYEMKYNDKKNPYSYRGFGYDTQTNILVEFLKSRVIGMNVVNFFIGRNRKSHSF